MLCDRIENCWEWHFEEKEELSFQEMSSLVEAVLEGWSLDGDRWHRSGSRADVVGKRHWLYQCDTVGKNFFEPKTG
jgi:hypothetical protein